MGSGWFVVKPVLRHQGIARKLVNRCMQDIVVLEMSYIVKMIMDK